MAIRHTGAWLAFVAAMALSLVSADVALSIPASAENLNTPASITVGTASRAVNGVNRARETDDLILYSSDFGVSTGTNQWGVEAVVQCGTVCVVQSYRDRQPTQDTTPTAIPAKPGFVISGHNVSADWMRSNVKVGDTVTVRDSTGAVTTWPGGGPTGTPSTQPTPSASPTTTPAPGAYPAREVAGYQMLWSNDRDVLGSLPAQLNVVRLAFFNDGGNIPGGVSPGIVGYTSAGKSSMVSELRSFVGRGGKVTLSLGGGGQRLSLGNPTNVVNRIRAVISDLSDGQGPLVTGIDWDIESNDFTDSGVFSVSQQLVQAYGPDFAVSMVPNGGNIDTYLSTGKRLWQGGYLSSFGQQFYDAPMSESAIGHRVSQYLGTGMPISLYAIGMMIGTDSSHPSEATYNTWFTHLQQAHPGLDRAYLWELSRSGTAQWAADIAAAEAAR